MDRLLVADADELFAMSVLFANDMEHRTKNMKTICNFLQVLVGSPFWLTGCKPESLLVQAAPIIKIDPCPNHPNDLIQIQLSLGRRMRNIAKERVIHAYPYAFSEALLSNVRALTQDLNNWTLTLALGGAQCGKDSCIRRFAQHPLYERQLWRLMLNMASYPVDRDNNTVDDDFPTVVQD